MVFDENARVSAVGRNQEARSNTVGKDVFIGTMFSRNHMDRRLDMSNKKQNRSIKVSKSNVWLGAQVGRSRL